MIMMDSLRKKVLWIVIQALFVGCLASGIVDYAINRRLTWSLIVFGGSVLSLLAVFPALCIRPRPLLFALMGVSIGTIPYLWLIGYSIGDTSWFPIGVIIAGLSIAYAWFCYLLLVLGKSTAVTRSGWMLVGAGILSFAITMVAGDRDILWQIVNLAILCVLGAVLIIRGGGPQIKVKI